MQVENNWRLLTVCDSPVYPAYAKDDHALLARQILRGPVGARETAGPRRPTRLRADPRSATITLAAGHITQSEGGQISSVDKFRTQDRQSRNQSG
jgi:hypothetical protein